jgi:hypothetical protein
MANREFGDFNDDGKVDISDLNTCLLEWGRYTVTDLNNLLSNWGKTIPTSPNSNKPYDFIIVGGGPAGIMSVYQIAKNNPKKRILLLEKNKNTLEEYKTPFPTKINGFEIQIDYKDAFNWRISQQDERFQNSYLSEDGKTIWVGKGLGGGTLHFGLQYIDNEKVIQNFNSDWKSDFNSVADITSAERYIETNNAAYNELILYLINENGVNYFNNKVYSDDLGKRKRLLLGDLINNLSNVEIKYKINISKYVLDDNTSYVLDDKDNKYYADNFIMCAGAIETPAILLRSGIGPNGSIQKLPVGQKLYDHSGFTIVYGKIKKKFVLNDANIEKLNKYNQSKHIHQVVNGPGHGNVYEFSNWVDKHPGGRYAITKSKNQGNVLRYPHSDSRWNSHAPKSEHHSDGSNENKENKENNENFIYIGKAGQEIFYDALPDNIKNKELENSLFPDTEIEETIYERVSDLGFDNNNILSHVQTRDDEMTWQTYYSTIPNLDNMIILTHALAGHLSGAGNIVIGSDGKKDVTLNHFGIDDQDKNKYLNYLKDAYQKNHKIMTKLGYTIINPPNFNENMIELMANSIYHYHGTCAIGDVVDENQKVKGTKNLYIGDISVLNKPWAGSTSVPAMVTGYRVAKNFINNKK